jgi:hypothetical protein
MYFEFILNTKSLAKNTALLLPYTQYKDIIYVNTKSTTVV